MIKENKTAIIIALLGIYIYAQIIWWAYYLINMHRKLADLDASVDLEDNILMIVGEGSVFMVLLGIGFIWLFRSVRKEYRLQKTQRNFMLSVTHELKTPLAAIQLNLETLLRQNIEPEKREQLIHRALSQNRRLDDLVENILLINGIDRNTFKVRSEEIIIEDLIQEVLEQFQPEQRNKVNLHLEATQIKLDRFCLYQIIFNLLSNALKYCEKAVDFHLNLQDGYLVFKVIDDGKGIDPRHRKDVFKKFHRIEDERTRNFKGTGLGLFIVKSLLQYVSGTIQVLSNQPKGTIFEVRIPTTLKN